MGHFCVNSDFQINDDESPKIESHFTLNSLCQTIREKCANLYKDDIKDEVVLQELCELYTEYNLLLDGYIFEAGYNEEQKRKAVVEKLNDAYKKEQTDKEIEDFLTSYSL